LVLANAATSFIVIPLVLVLPSIIVMTRDAQSKSAAAELSVAPTRAVQE
jgi:hypothetical protein